MISFSRAHGACELSRSNIEKQQKNRRVSETVRAVFFCCNVDQSLPFVTSAAASDRSSASCAVTAAKPSSAS